MCFFLLGIKTKNGSSDSQKHFSSNPFGSDSTDFRKNTNNCQTGPRILSLPSHRSLQHLCLRENGPSSAINSWKSGKKFTSPFTTLVNWKLKKYMLLTVSYSVFTGIISESYLTCSPIRITVFFRISSEEMPTYLYWTKSWKLHPTFTAETSEVVQ